MLHTTTQSPTFAQALVAWWFRLFLAVAEPLINPQPAVRQPPLARRTVPSTGQRLYPIPPERVHLYAHAADEGW